MLRNLNDSVTVLFMMVSGGRAGGFLLKSMIISTVLSVFSSRLLKTLGSQILSFLTVSRPVIVLYEADHCGVVCELPELDRGVFGCAVVRVEREEQWGENTALRGSSFDRTGAGLEFSQPHYNNKLQQIKL